MTEIEKAFNNLLSIDLEKIRTKREEDAEEMSKLDDSRKITETSVSGNASVINMNNIFDKASENNHVQKTMNNLLNQANKNFTKMIKSEDVEYPISGVENARKVLSWRLEYGQIVKGFTENGWKRVEKIAAGESLSSEDVKKISEVQESLFKSISEEDFCDRRAVVFYGLGGTEMIKWAKDKSSS